jgi:hypothetical protein
VHEHRVLGEPGIHQERGVFPITKGDGENPAVERNQCHEVLPVLVGKCRAVAWHSGTLGALPNSVGPGSVAVGVQAMEELELETSVLR